jgi:hypothetical protein
MARQQITNPDRPRRSGRNHAQFAPVVWILILLASWLLIVEWQTLPDMASAALAALP